MYTVWPVSLSIQLCCNCRLPFVSCFFLFFFLLLGFEDCCDLSEVWSLALVAPLDEALGLSEPTVAGCWLVVVCSTCDFFDFDPCPESVELLDSYSWCWLYSSASCSELNTFFMGDLSSAFFRGDSARTWD